MTREQIERLEAQADEHVTLCGGTSVNEQPAAAERGSVREPVFTDMSRQRREDMLKLVIRRYVHAA
jgi:hypothetical protein